MIKITPADSAFSKCVRARADWVCERCESVHERNSTGLHCSHFIGRGNWATRFEPLNGIALCYGCHMKMQGDPVAHRQLVTNIIGEQLVEYLVAQSNNTQEGKRLRKTKGVGPIAKHFREEYERLVWQIESCDWCGEPVPAEFRPWA